MTMAWKDDAAAALDASYEVFGEPALWPFTAATAVTVIRDAGETDVVVGGPRVTADTMVLLVRRAEVASPARGQLVKVGEVTYRIVAEPQAHDDLQLEWACEAAPNRPVT